MTPKTMTWAGCFAMEVLLTSVKLMIVLVVQKNTHYEDFLIREYLNFETIILAESAH